jgi:hypothetical protein
MSLFQRLLCLASFLSIIPDRPAKTEGIAPGMTAGNTIPALRSNDGAYQNPIVDIAPSTVPGVYVAVPPFTLILFVKKCSDFLSSSIVRFNCRKK